MIGVCVFKYLGRVKIYLLFLLVFPYFLSARPIDTFYGVIEVEEPVILELIDSPVFQRLKNIRQYGISYYTGFSEAYTRYDHSVGVFAILRANKASIEEQIAGLLHDVSHTAFSHVGDWVFSKENQDKDYQNDIHPQFLKESGLADILEKYNITIQQVLPTEELFPALENSLPNLCADRIDYNIQGAYYRNFITYEEALSLFKSLQFVNNQWISNELSLMKKVVRFSLFMTQNCWGGPFNDITSSWLAEAILRAIDLGVLSQQDFHYGADQEIWEKLMLHEDPIIKEKMKMIANPLDFFSIIDVAEDADLIVRSKFRGINPWILIGSECKRITELDDQLAEEYVKTKQMMSNGFLIKYFK